MVRALMLQACLVAAHGPADASNAAVGDETFAMLATSQRGNARPRILTARYGSSDAFDEVDTVDHAHVTNTYQSKLLVTTGLWYLDISKMGDADATKLTYDNCMSELMSLNTPMAIYGDADALSTMLESRSKFGLSQLISEEAPVRNMSLCRKEYDELVQKRGGAANLTYVPHVPFMELGCVWDGKVSLMRRSAKAQPGFDWYGWADICSNIDHGTDPWPRPEALAKLSPDKITVAQGMPELDLQYCTDGLWEYCHGIAGGAFVVPASLIDWMDEEFAKLVKECLTNAEGPWVCLSDQVVLTQMYLRHEDRFEMLDEVGWEAVAFNVLNEGSDEF